VTERTGGDYPPGGCVRLILSATPRFLRSSLCLMPWELTLFAANC